MFDQNIQRIGFACKIQESEGKADPKLNTKTTTLTWLNSKTKDVAVERLYSIAKDNILASPYGGRSESCTSGNALDPPPVRFG